ncbi:GNAT family N-acetyltransferase [Ktedonosporobacter rubrisoli]|uniref:GNAT family N-acetyltransferase n=1 Tax=Ktedonosporobacter rubrisoli TaxID=2509675 RepID=A0A4P6JVC6_KTERU|nr:GNAT family N-acetyltransferase [Ktedonosporobacter rubrisoli]QBD79474.1 GNAT family N-acetyltransferase [Ktedonosporobacter rubrisoli]
MQDMNTLLIRPCQLDEIPQILEIRQRIFLHFAPAVYSSKEVENLLEDFKTSELEEMIENKSLFVAEENHKIVGCGGWLGEAVRHMYVSPEETKKGIGSALLRVLEEDFKNRTNSSIIKAGVILYARPFYERNGYEFLQIDTNWDGSKFNRMQKKLL